MILRRGCIPAAVAAFLNAHAAAAVPLRGLLSPLLSPPATPVYACPRSARVIASSSSSAGAGSTEPPDKAAAAADKRQQRARLEEARRLIQKASSELPPEAPAPPPAPQRQQRRQRHPAVQQQQQQQPHNPPPPRGRGRAAAAAAAGEAAAAEEAAAEEVTQRAAAAQEDADYSRALSRAMRLINFRERASKELRERLLQDGYTEGVAERVVARMQELGLQDDGRFAQMYARGRWRSSVRAPMQIARELKMKGVGEAEVREALEVVFGPGGRLAPDDHGGDEEEDGERDGPWEVLVEQARRRAELTEHEDIQKRRAKLARWLQYRGHSWDTVKRLMKEVGL